MKDYRFCPICKTSLKRRLIEGRRRLFCRDCGWISYRNPVPVAACLVLKKNSGLLLVKRGIEPCVGAWALPGGYIELDETPEEAAVRELSEETGLNGLPCRVTGIETQNSKTYGRVMVIGVALKVKSFKTSPGDDALAAEFFPLNALPDIPFKSHNALIQTFLYARPCREIPVKKP